MPAVGDTFPALALKAVKGGPEGRNLDTVLTDVGSDTNAGNDRRGDALPSPRPWMRNARQPGGWWPEIGVTIGAEPCDEAATDYRVSTTGSASAATQTSRQPARPRR